jgi:hypothetical protein
MTGPVFAVLVAFALGVTLGHSSHASALPASSARYGGLPSWLPKPKVTVGRVVQASAAHPWLAAIEGDSVSVHLAHGRVMATVVGPAVPANAPALAQAARSPNADITLCTFTATFAGASGRVPINANAFTIVDEQGQVSHLGVTTTRGGPAPGRVRQGQTVTLTMKSVLPEGEYILRWAPAGHKVLVGWEFNVELD